jgi:hypothetical protein
MFISKRDDRELENGCYKIVRKAAVRIQLANIVL